MLFRSTKSTKQVKVWDVASREEVAGMEAPSDQHTSMFFSPDDKWLVAGCGRVACVWETQTWKEREKLPNGGKVWSVAFSSDSSLLATASYHSEIAQVYETANWKPIAQIKPGGGWVRAVAFIPQSHLLVVSGGSTKVWEITEPTRPLAEIISRSGVTDTIALSPDGGWLATEGGLWEVSRKDNKTVSFKKGEKKGGIPLAFSPDGRYLVTASSGARTTTQIWEVATGREVTRLATSMTSATFSPDGHLLTTGQPDGTIKEWAVDAKEAIRLPHGDQVKVNAVAYSPDGQWLATGSSDHLARVFQTSDWQEVVKMEHEKAVSTTAFSPGGRWLITLNGNTIQLFETATWHNVITKKYEDEVSAVAFNSDGRRLIAVSGNTVQLFVFEAASWREVRPMIHEGGVESLSFSPDGKWLATKTKGDCNRYEGLRRLTKTRVWDVATGDEVAWVWHKDDDMSCHKYPPGIESHYGVADVTTAATFRIATVYRDFGKALMSSERPKKLSKVEREQYDVLLEEQAFPFEEKATEYHEVNARRAANGIYDKWVKSSFDALRELRPVRYGKNERGEEVIDAIR